MFATIETRFGGNAATKKTQKTLLKQQYENFSATKDLNSKFLSSLPPEWNTHVVVWMNKPKVETISIADLYNNFKIVEQKVNKSIGTSSGAQNLAFMTAPSTSSTNDANTASPQVSAASPNVNDLEQIHKDDLEGKYCEVAAHLLRTLCQGAPRSKEGFDWSDMEEEQVQTNMALMAFSNSKEYTDKTCSKTCLKNYETLKK
ncbi:hypothetical protein Tco_0911020 [Tanacetum coccineum]|uniref:Uncharacterized protein n=1 Tax=Tanacetum coccineum TaxID=301880 RepID=A0ABQ5CVN0_9ASTR